MRISLALLVTLLLLSSCASYQDRGVSGSKSKNGAFHYHGNGNAAREVGRNR